MQRYKPFFNLYLDEAIINVQEYFIPIEKKCKEFSKLFTKDKGFEHTCTKLSLLLKKYKIKFVYEDYTMNTGDFLSANGFNFGEVINDKSFTIIMHCNSNINSIFYNYPSFIKAFFSVLRHELIHRIQYMKIEYKTLQKVIDRKEPFDDNIYLNDAHEIMAFAWQLVDYYRLMRLSKEQILKVLQKPYEYLELQNNILSGFIRANRKGVVTDKSLKLLYKYAYEYAKEV